MLHHRTNFQDIFFLLTLKYNLSNKFDEPTLVQWLQNYLVCHASARRLSKKLGVSPTLLFSFMDPYLLVLLATFVFFNWGQCYVFLWGEVSSYISLWVALILIPFKRDIFFGWNMNTFDLFCLYLKPLWSISPFWIANLWENPMFGMKCKMWKVKMFVKY